MRLVNWNEFDKHARVAWAAADTEAYTLIDGVRVSTDEMLKLSAEHDTAWWRKHVSVDVYAWLISDGTRSACFDTWDAFIQFCADHRVQTLWWYNAKYDFAHVDYTILTSGWSMNTGGKIKHNEYRSLHGTRGQRYSMTFGREYTNSTRHKHVHKVSFYDLCNIFGGGLAKNLVAFDVRDNDGKPIRKLEMDYQGGSDEATARAYMVADVHGLYHLVRTADTFLRDRWGYTLTGNKPDVMTAGGLAKRVLLSYCNGFSKDHRDNVKQFQRWHLVDIGSDSFYRVHGLYRGGITLVNPDHQNKPLTRPIYKYDINSMYPYQMSRMPDLIGRPARVSVREWCEKYANSGEWCGAYLLTAIDARMRAGMLPTWYDRLNREYTPRAYQTDTDTPTLIFTNEFDELRHWYDIDEYNTRIDCVYMWRTAPANGFHQFIADNYELKREGKRTHNKPMEAFAKLLLNSSYGKLAENPRREQSHREINPETGAVSLIDDGEEIDEKTLLSVVMGALVTSMARTQLLALIRDVCPVPARDFIYCDTDSIASFTQYDKCDPYTLGALKDETEINGTPHPYTWGKYIAPKTYALYRVVDGVPELDIHSKGMPLSCIFSPADADEARAVGKISAYMPIAEINALFASGRRFTALAGMNVRGGKALVPLQKYLCRADNTIMDGTNNDPANMSLLLKE